MKHLQLNVFNLKNHQDIHHKENTRLTSLANVNHHKSLKSYLDDIEREIISDCLTECDGNISKTARRLNVPQQSMSRKIKQFNLHSLIYDIKKTQSKQGSLENG